MSRNSAASKRSKLEVTEISDQSINYLLSKPASNHFQTQDNSLKRCLGAIIMFLEGYPFSLGTTTLLECSAEQELEMNKGCWKRRPGNQVAAWESAMMEQRAQA